MGADREKDAGARSARQRSRFRVAPTGLKRVAIFRCHPIRKNFTTNKLIQPFGGTKVPPENYSFSFDFWNLNICND